MEKSFNYSPACAGFGSILRLHPSCGGWLWPPVRIFVQVLLWDWTLTLLVLAAVEKS